MKNQAFFKTLVLISLIFVTVMSVPVWGAEGSPARRGGGGRGVYGDWDLKVKFGERDMDSILSFSRDEEGNLIADWVSFWGVNRLQDVKYEEGKLSFLQVVQFRGEEMRSTFTGAIEEGKLDGVLSGERGDSDVLGQRSRRMSRAAGIWELKYKMGEREIASSLIITADEEGELSAEWKNERVQSDVTDFSYERGVLTFKRKTKMGDNEWDSTFEGRIDRQSRLLTGTIKSDRGEVPVEGKRMGEALIGVWDLDMTAGERAFKQRLRVNPDMTALYGTLPVKKIELKDGKVTFEAEWEFGDRTFEMSLEGTLVDDKLTGEVATARGSQKFEGKKMVRNFRRRAGGVGRTN